MEKSFGAGLGAGRWPIATAKLHPRLTSPRPVARTHLLNRLRDAEEATLVLVNGPAGFGKTTVMLQYFAQLQSSTTATGWITLDRADNDLGRFLRYLIEALRGIDPGVVSGLEQREADLAGDTEGAVLDLANRLALHAGRFVLFMDDFELIESPVVLGLMRQLIDYLPDGGQVVIGSRTNPDLGLGRLRVLGRLSEIKAAELRFSPHETAAFLRQQRGLSLRDDHILRLQQRTEGWPAALWLVSLALRDRGDPEDFVNTFDGSEASITDYLAEDVLSRQPEVLRHFLLQTSVLQDLSAPLCDWLLERDDSARMLERIERAQLFLVAQDADRHWFRYHPLFRGFLLAQIEKTAGSQVASLHRRAATWSWQQGQKARAVEHALQADDPQYLLELLSAHTHALLWQGRARTLARWYAAAKLGDRLWDQPVLALTFAWAMTLTRRYDESLTLLDGVQARHGARVSEQDRQLCTTTDVQRAFIYAMTDRVRLSLAQWQACLPDVSPAEQPFSYAMLGASYGYCLVAASRFDEARHFLEQSRRRGLEFGNSFVAAMTLCLQGAIDFAQGRLKNAIASFRAAVLDGNSNSPPQAASNTVAAAFLAEALYETDALDEAERLLNVYLPLLKEAAAPDQLITSYVTLARIALARGLGQRASEWLDAMELAGHHDGLPRMVASARLERARWSLLAGSTPVGADPTSGDDADDSIWREFDGLVTHANDTDAPLIAVFRSHIRAGRSQQALAPLKQAIREAEGLRRHRRALKLNILLAEALCGAGQRALGMRVLREALQVGANEGFVRSFVDEGASVLRYVAELRESTVESHFDDPSTRALTEFIDRVLVSAGHRRPTASVPSAVAATGLSTVGAAVVPAGGGLSARELQVLRLLAGGHRNQIIATRLFVSETTVKAHLRSINVKLGTQSRTHAVAVARQLGLVG